MRDRKSAQLQYLSGFTLIEVAVVLAIIATLLGTLLVPLATQVQVTRIKSTDRSLDEVREALLGFAMANGRLPCPDSIDLLGAAAPDGIEDQAAPGPCAALTGRLPFVTLGIPPGDAWGRRFSYQVDPNFAFPVQPGAACATADQFLGLCDVGGLTVNGRAPDDKSVRTLSASSIAVVVSHGANGFGAIDVAGVALPAAAAGTDEAENADAGANAVYVARSRTPAVGGCLDLPGAPPLPPFCEFDDQLMWLSSNVLFNRLVTAGVLP